MLRVSLIAAVIFGAVFASAQEGRLYLKYDDRQCNTLGTGGDVASVGLADCENCRTTSCLHIIHNTATTWDAAKEYCEKLKELSEETHDSTIDSSHLAIILNEAKLEAVKAFLDGLSGTMKPRAAWIGLRSSNGLGTCSSWERFLCLTGTSQCACKQWSWLDAVPASGSPNYWAAGQPSGAWSINGGNCAKMVRDHQWRYFDDPCSTSFNFWRQPNAVLCEASIKLMA